MREDVPIEICFSRNKKLTCHHRKKLDNLFHHLKWCILKYGAPRNKAKEDEVIRNHTLLLQNYLKPSSLLCLNLVENSQKIFPKAQ